MLLPGCQCCGSCECTRTCTEPHTGAAFETVFTNYFEGVEVGNPSDGFLTATGDNDASDPYDGMDGSGPWVQEISGGFSDGGSYGTGTRFPCAYRFSFWRSTRQLGINNPAPSTALTENVIELTVSAGAVVYPDGTVITPASGTVALATVPLVSGGAGAVDPRTSDGTVSFVLQCQNVETTFSVTARIRWNVQKRQHTLYGIVRECYEEGTPCATFCSGSPPPDTIYLTISNVNVTAIASGSYGSATFGAGVAGANAAGNVVEQTYVLDRVPNICSGWIGSAPGGECDPPFSPGLGVSISATSSSGSGLVRMNTGRGNDCAGSYGLRFTFSGSPLPICGTWSRSGTSTDIRNDDAIAGSAVFTGSFDWSVYT